MSDLKQYVLSVVVPVYNEGRGLASFHTSLDTVLRETVKDSYEIIYCDDGSTDNTAQLVSKWHSENAHVKLIKLSRNFGKENSLSAGIANATGEAILMLDGDGQHPVELIPQFVSAWRQGARVVVGVRTNDSGSGWVKQGGSRLFYRLFNRMTGNSLVPGSTDFRLIDHQVQTAFLRLSETDRMTRGLIDWLGFERQYIPFVSKMRQEGAPGYSQRKLVQLAMNSIVSSSAVPLYLFGYIGVFITGFALILGTIVFVEQLLLSDPLHWRFTGTAMLSILLLFLVGMILMSQGLLSLYISHIHRQSKQRPLYVIDYEKSVGIKEHERS